MSGKICDIVVKVGPTGLDGTRGESSGYIRARVQAARARQMDRQGMLNGTLACAGVPVLEAVARTIADLEGVKLVDDKHMVEAVGLINQVENY
jgi:predicted ATPase with chaperone activity